mmetsp:Transcript_16574/g.36538  ORF Transcript_16574/g.36538 Transcript_16574/m.36538 type:complete len:206 (-) Transcript_16574:51-668(-)
MFSSPRNMRVRILDAVQFDSIPAIARNSSGLKMCKRCWKVRLFGFFGVFLLLRFWCRLSWFPDEVVPSCFLPFDAFLLDLSLPKPRSRLSRRVGANEKFLLSRMDRIKDSSSSSPSSNILTVNQVVGMDRNRRNRSVVCVRRRVHILNAYRHSFISRACMQQLGHALNAQRTSASTTSSTGCEAASSAVSLNGNGPASVRSHAEP